MRGYETLLPLIKMSMGLNDQQIERIEGACKVAYLEGKTDQSLEDVRRLDAAVVNLQTSLKP